MNFDLNYWGVLVAAVVPFLLGWAWYSPMLFGKQWMELKGIKPDPSKNKEAMMCMAWGFAMELVMAFFMSYAANTLGISEWSTGLSMGLFVWFGFILMTSLRAKMYGGDKDCRLWRIDNGYMLLEFALMGALIGLMQ